MDYHKYKNKLLKKINKFWQKVRANVERFFRQAITKYLVWKYIRSNRLEYFRITYIKPNIRAILRQFIVSIAVISAILVASSIEYTNLNEDLISNWSIAIAGMIGGVFAIVFTFLQNVQTSSPYVQSDRMYRDFINDSKQKIFYVFFASTIIYFVFLGLVDLLVLSNILLRYNLGLAIVLIGLVLAVIDYLHEESLRKMQPESQLAYIEKRALKFLSKVEKDIRKIAFALKFARADKNEKQANDIAYLSRRQFAGIYAEHIEYILSVAASLANQGKIDDTKIAMNKARNLIIKYIRFGEHKFFLQADKSSPLNIESDNQKAFSIILEAINRLGKYFVREDLEVNAIDLVYLYQEILLPSCKIKYANGLPINQNPIALQIINYFDKYIEESARHNRLEVIWQTLYVLEKAGLSSLNENIMLLDHFVLKDIDRIYEWGFINNQVIIIERCREIWANLLEQTVLLGGEDTKVLLEKIFNSFTGTQKTLVHNNFYLHSNFKLFIELLKPKSIELFIKTKAKEYKDTQNFMTFIEELGTVVRTYADNAIFVNYHSAIGNFLITIVNITVEMMRKEKNSRKKEFLAAELKRYAHLSYWFFAGAQRVELRESSKLLELTTVIGVRSILDLGNNDIAESAERALESILDKFINKNNVSLGFEEPRAALFLSYLGVVALKNDYSALFEKIKKYILKFESDYITKYKETIDLGAGLHREQIYFELLSWKDDFEKNKNDQHYLGFDYLETLLREKIEVVDIKKYISVIWEEGKSDELV